MIIRGTTPYHGFILPILVEDVEVIWVTYCQNERIVIEKDWTIDSTDERISFEDLTDLYENASMEQLTEEEQHSSQLTIHLSQEDTLGFTFFPAARKNIAVIEMRVLTTDGEAYAIEPIKERIFGVRRDGVISNESEQENEQP